MKQAEHKETLFPSGPKIAADILETAEYCMGIP